MFSAPFNFSKVPLTSEEIASAKVACHFDSRWYNVYLDYFPAILLFQVALLFSGLITIISMKYVSFSVACAIFFPFVFYFVMQTFFTMTAIDRRWQLRDVTAENELSDAGSKHISCQDVLDLFEQHPELQGYHQQVLQMHRPFLQGEVEWLQQTVNQPCHSARSACNTLYSGS
ncbi:hypothetical protein HF673_05550 [Acidithiobacillus thiooxidans]|jgi:hypothetical protein|uniref:hypothetical protein n=1 Tax=Acidithiobacillus thiooxidans TaxID=930 RepID=UPI0004E201B6|nr:hypothetical protein [Acidithiobacillus thiooxidans]MBU2835264.1 hypothetical protein [Acidithiobacillus thiooxidans]